MGVVSVRLDDADEAFLRKRKMNISEIVRRRLHEHVVQMQLDERERFLAKVRRRPSQPSGKTIRELRDGG